jgi:hypothetical protein
MMKIYISNVQFEYVFFVIVFLLLFFLLLVIGYWLLVISY